MSFKRLLVGLLLGGCLSLAIGCGGGGGGGGGGGAVGPVPTSSITLSGVIELPAEIDPGWNSSIRAAIGLTGLTARAYDRYQVLLGEGTVNTDTGVFTLTISQAATRVVIEITNGRNFTFQKVLDNVSASVQDVRVNNQTTAEAYIALKGDSSLALTGTSILPLADAILAALRTNPTTASGSLFDLVETQVDKIFDQYVVEKTEIERVNDLLTTYLKEETLDPALPYFSPQFHSSTIPTVSLADFIVVTRRRFEKFSVEAYTFSIGKVLFTATDTATVTFDGYIRGRTNTLSVKTSTLDDYEYIMKKVNGTWIIYQDFPYLESQLNL